MNLDNIPNHVKRILQDKELPMDKKMNAFMAFMPKLPTDPKQDQAWRDNEKVGEQILQLINDGKLEIKYSNSHWWHPCNEMILKNYVI